MALHGDGHWGTGCGAFRTSCPRAQSSSQAADPSPMGRQEPRKSGSMSSLVRRPVRSAAGRLQGRNMSPSPAQAPPAQAGLAAPQQQKRAGSEAELSPSASSPCREAKARISQQLEVTPLLTSLKIRPCCHLEIDSRMEKVTTKTRLYR